MSVIFLLSGGLVCLLFLYLVAALLYPEKF